MKDQTALNDIIWMLNHSMVDASILEAMRAYYSEEGREPTEDEFDAVYYALDAWMYWEQLKLSVQ